MLTTSKEEKLDELPRIKTTISKSKNGKYVLHKTTITDIKPRGYYETILDEAKKIEF